MLGAAAAAAACGGGEEREPVNLEKFRDLKGLHELFEGVQRRSKYPESSEGSAGPAPRASLEPEGKADTRGGG